MGGLFLHVMRIDKLPSYPAGKAQLVSFHSLVLIFQTIRLMNAVNIAEPIREGLWLGCFGCQCVM